MPLSVRDGAYIIPGYSLTGDLLAYRRCGLQYRYYNRGALPPSRPVQQWFGEFIHGVLEEAYRQWRESGATPLPWSQPEIEAIEDDIVRRLAARGLRYRNRNLLDISKERGALAINTLGPHLFPLIAEAELPLSAVRPMPARGRADFYEVNGIVDVLTSIELGGADPSNVLIRALNAHEETAEQLDRGRRDPKYRFEVIVDYKGMARPEISSPFLNDLRWQLLTYAWLRQRQPGAARVVAGVLVFINELLPTVEEIASLKRAITANPPDTDVLPIDDDLSRLTSWRRASGRLLLSEEFRIDRSLMIVPVSDADIQFALAQFDGTVTDIERSVIAEMGGAPLGVGWSANPLEQSCAVCDWRASCPSTLPRFQGAPTAP